ncbi:MAG: hypothetical protein COB90_06445 [Hyphomicrobiales bacterium]|nr:MAG: hypothetical protein COB90_06445 [Hyphomicrobiales bacterium]
MGNIKGLLFLGVVAVIGFTYLNGSSGPASADLGIVLDRTKVAIEQYQDYLGDQKITEVTDQHMSELAVYMNDVMNAEPRISDAPVAVDILADASFLGYADVNDNLILDEGDTKLFTVEIDSQNERLIASDGSGNATHTGFSGTGFLAGMLIGNMLTRQRSAGVKPGSFNNRTSTPRSAYKSSSSARSRVRSGGLSGGK